MDLLEDFDRARTTLSELGAMGERFEMLSSGEDAEAAEALAAGVGGAGLVPDASTSYADLPTLSIELTSRQAARLVFGGRMGGRKLVCVVLSQRVWVCAGWVCGCVGVCRVARFCRLVWSAWRSSSPREPSTPAVLTRMQCTTATATVSTRHNRGRGQIVAAAYAADTVLLATSKGYVLRYHWDDHGNERGGRVHACAWGPDVQECACACTWGHVHGGHVHLHEGLCMGAPPVLCVYANIPPCSSPLLKTTAKSPPSLTSPLTPAKPPVLETELTKSQDLAVRSVYLNPGGQHMLIVLRNTRTGAMETHYMHRWVRWLWGRRGVKVATNLCSHTHSIPNANAHLATTTTTQTTTPTPPPPPKPQHAHPQHLDARAPPQQAAGPGCVGGGVAAAAEGAGGRWG